MNFSIAIYVVNSIFYISTFGFYLKLTLIACTYRNKELMISFERLLVFVLKCVRHFHLATNHNR